MMLEKEIIEANLQYVVSQYNELVDLLISKQNEEGVSRVSKSDMAARFGISKGEVSNQLEKFISLGLIEKAGITGYRVLHRDFMNTPFGIIFDLLKVIDENPNLSYKQQAGELGVTEKEIEIIYGYLVYLLK